MHGCGGGGMHTGCGGGGGGAQGFDLGGTVITRG